MKKAWLASGVIIVLIASLIAAFYSPEALLPDHPEGKTLYYAKITDPGIPDVNGRYDYEVTAFNKNGEEKKLVFSAGKELRDGAYIQLYYAFFRGDTYWKEVSFEELPLPVQQKIKNI